jgi:hypothetical protein
MNPPIRPIDCHGSIQCYGRGDFGIHDEITITPKSIRATCAWTSSEVCRHSSATTDGAARPGGRLARRVRVCNHLPLMVCMPTSGTIHSTVRPWLPMAVSTAGQTSSRCQGPGLVNHGRPSPSQLYQPHQRGLRPMS